MTEVESREVIRQMARLFIERATNFGWKGKKRDDLALEFFMGAAKAVENLDEGLYKHLHAIVFLLAVRGYDEVLILAKDEVNVG